MTLYLDYSLKTPEERIQAANKIMKTTTSPQTLSALSDYILFITDKGQTKKEKQEENPIITKNREYTVSKRQISYEQLIASLQNGEDGLHNLITNDKNQFLDRKDKITQEELDTFPQLQEQMDILIKLQDKLDKTTGNKHRALKKQIIEQWQQIYSIRSGLKPTSAKHSNQIKALARLELPEDIYVKKDDSLVINGLISLLRPSDVELLLNNYSKLKEECYEVLDGDMHWLLIDLEDLIHRTFADSPVYYNLIIWKIDGRTNEEIVDLMKVYFNIEHSAQYYSSLWRQRIPKMLSEQARKEWVIWHYENEEYGEWKLCSRCGEWLPVHPLFFGKNSTKNGFYSICKSCRTKIKKSSLE